MLEELTRQRAKSLKDSKEKGRKRSASPSSPEEPRKRAKTATGSYNSGDNTVSSHDWESEYPAVKHSRQSYELQSVHQDCRHEQVPVLRHVLNLHYTDLLKNGSPSDDEEESLADLIKELRDPISGSTTFDLGRLSLREHSSRTVASPYHSKKWLLLLPELAQDLEDHDYTATPSSADLLLACLILKAARKVSLQVTLALVLNPPGVDTMDLDVPFCLQIEILVAVNIPYIFEPVARKESIRRTQEVDNAQRRLLTHVYGSCPNPSEVNISFFYSILHGAPRIPSLMADNATQPDLLNAALLPFQRRSVAWLLHREGMEITPTEAIVTKSSPGDDFSFWETITEGNHTWYFNRLSGALSMEPVEASFDTCGGILAEEPGLGKTLETIALILLNPSPPSRNPTVTTWDPEAQLDVKAVKTSLIVTPPALASQWVDEVAAHAPSLKVLVYDGWSKVKVPITRTQLEEERAKKQSHRRKVSSRAKGKSRTAKSKGEEALDMTHDEEGNLLEWCDYVHQFDVVITTYQVLSSDLNVARAAPVRPRREDVVYSNVERPRSPLVMVEWNRVIMDEVQMVGGGKIEDMVSLIPRLSSLAVSGTPARAQIPDLIHVLKFLRADKIIGSARLWNRLVKPGFSHEFASFFQNYAIRTTKASVKEELTIPQQTRYLVPIELGKVERHVYDQLLEAVLLELGLDARGVAGSNGWEVDATLLRSSIRRLRGICTHPQVGQLQKRGDNYKRGALKSMDAVLQNMRDQNWKNVMEDSKAKIQAMVRYAQLIQGDEDLPNRYQIALQTLQTAEKEANHHIEEVVTALADHKAAGEILKREAAARRQAQTEADSNAAAEDPTVKGKAKALRDDGDTEDDDDEGEEENVEDKGLPKTHAGKEHRVKTLALRQRLREWKLTLHRVKFLQGDVFHVLGKDHAGAEDNAYESAEKIRRELLKATEEDANHAMDLLDDPTRKRPTLNDLLIKLPYLGKGGIRSADLMEEMNTLIGQVLNEQTKLLWKWRAKITEILTQKLNPGEEADGQEYQRTLDNQGEVEVYMQAYNALLADRREALVNERTLLAAHDVREKRLRHTRAAMKAARALDASDGEELQAPDGFELQPEYQVLYKELSDQRKALLAKLNGRAIKSVLVELNNINNDRVGAKEVERQIITNAIKDIRALMSSQGNLQDKLDSDLTRMRKAFNERILYFRQLQEISDSVAEVVWEEDTLAEALESSLLERVELEGKINTNRARHRYLENLTSNNGKFVEDDDDDEETACILCRCDFVRGFITQCAHIFCEGCMRAWLARREGKTCPVCRVPIDPDSVQRFTLNPTEAEAPKQPINGEPAPQSLRKIAYNNIDDAVYDQIQNMESYGDFGSKIQTLIRHILFLQGQDPGAKSIVFSAWADSLHIVEWALSHNGIRCLRIDQHSKGENAAKKFKTDSEILVLLLHGERENAGLNITCASRVFLLESVVHHSFEIQAIARIDRMGQSRPTEVFCYYAEDTIERNILDLAARKGLSLYTKDNSAGTLDISSFSQENEPKVVDSPAKKRQKGDFIFKIDDMLAILFPHMFEEVEYLLPPQDNVSEDSEMADVTAKSTITARPRRQLRSRSQSNAVAGPSRLRSRT